MAAMDLLDSTSGTFIVTGILLFLYLFYCFLVRPLNRVMKLGDLGFYFGNPKVCFHVFASYLNL